MESHELKLPDGYDLGHQKILAYFAAQLDAQLEQLKKSVKDLTVAQSEWQSRPGMNTIGMLLAHNAIVEAFWISVAAAGFQPKPDGEKIIRDLIGLSGDDDGIPLADDGQHPETLKGKTLEEYLAMLDTARLASHRMLQSWSDDSLTTAYVLEEKYEFTRAWTVYHVLEHFIGHLGQIRLIKHLMAKEG